MGTNNSISDKATGKGLLQAKAARALARAKAILDGDNEPASITDKLNTGKLTKLLVWRVKTILAEQQGKGYRIRGRGVLAGLRSSNKETPDASAGNFCYSIF